MKKRVLAVTGIRSEYDILRPVISLLRKDKCFDVGVVVTGAHLTKWHGYTIKVIKQDGFKIAGTIHSLLLKNTGLQQRAKAAGLLICGLAEAVERYKPHFILVVGDREESIAAAAVANYMNTLLAHIGGGDSVYGNSDDPVRFAVSKLAHLHFVTSQDSARNLLKIGEDKFRIFNAGNPALDNIRMTPVMDKARLGRKLGLDLTSRPYFVLLYHPLSSEYKDAGKQMEILMQGIEEFCVKTGCLCLGIYPNTDPGALDILGVIDAYRNKKFVKFFKTLPRGLFVNLMRYSLALIGNSSMGILEMPFYKIPVVNIGNRQKGRLNAGNVRFIDFKTKLIVQALKKACLDSRYRKKVRLLKNPFGDGNSAARIKRVLASVDINNKEWYIKRGVR